MLNAIEYVSNVIFGMTRWPVDRILEFFVVLLNRNTTKGKTKANNYTVHALCANSYIRDSLIDTLVLSVLHSLAKIMLQTLSLKLSKLTETQLTEDPSAA